MTMKLILSLIFAFVAAWGFSARQQEMCLFKENIASIVNKDGRVFTLNGYVLQRKTFHICHPYQFIGLPH